MPHSLDVSKLGEIFQKLRDNMERLNSWECDRLDEWEPIWERGGKLSDNQLGCIEKMYLKVP
jgi:hypothetical protein